MLDKLMMLIVNNVPLRVQYFLLVPILCVFFVSEFLVIKLAIQLIKGGND